MAPIKLSHPTISTPASLLDAWQSPISDLTSQPEQITSPPAATHGPQGGKVVLFAPDGGSGAHAGTGGTGTSTGAVAAITTTGSPFVVNITWDSSVSSAPSQFQPAVLAAVQYLESQIRNAVTLNVSIGWGEVGGSSLGNYTLGASQSYLRNVSYSSLRTAMIGSVTSSDDASAAASLPASSPVSGNYWTTTAEAKALGLSSATSTSTDGFIGFSSSLPFSWSPSSGIAGGSYDFNAVALHEFTEVMGRMLLTGATIGSTANSYMPLDLMHYSGLGQRDFLASTPGYLSIDNGATNLGNFNTVSGGDAGDWGATMGNDAFNAFSNSGVVNAISASDLTALDVMGWARDGVAAAPVTGALAAAQTAGGLAAGASLATLAQLGGSTANSYAFNLTGAASGAFALSGATLTVGTTALVGTATGTLYALALSATDTTLGTTTTTDPLDIVVGSAGGDTIVLGTLAGALGATVPTFVYGLGGADTINGTGMAAKLWIDGGAGADTLTGGSGATTYLYGATGESTAAAMDVITNFHTATDLIDLTGLGTALAYAGKLSGSAIAAHSIGWATSGTNDFVYVNASGASESLTAADMKIEVAGKLTLGAGNFAHL